MMYPLSPHEVPQLRVKNMSIAIIFLFLQHSVLLLLHSCTIFCCELCIRLKVLSHAVVCSKLLPVLDEPVFLAIEGTIASHQHDVVEVVAGTQHRVKHTAMVELQRRNKRDRHHHAMKLVATSASNVCSLYIVT